MRITPADELLLSVLREDARASTADIARKLGLSRTTVQAQLQAFVDVHPDFETAIERLATWLARLDDPED